MDVTTKTWCRKRSISRAKLFQMENAESTRTTRTTRTTRIFPKISNISYYYYDYYYDNDDDFFLLT